jgi:hypothetical protein
MVRPFVAALADERPGLDPPWDGLRRLRVGPPPGTFVLVLGAPGSLKSTFALTWALHIRPRRTVMISLDTDSRTQAARLVAALQQIPVADVLRDPVTWAGWLELLGLPIRVIDRTVSVEDLDEILRAMRAYWGAPPDLVIIDDLSKLRMEERDYAGFDATMVEVHRLAREHGTVVLGLHHLHRGGSSNRDQPVRLADGKYTGEYEAEIVLGLWRPRADRLHIGVLKNRFAPDAPNGSLYVELIADPERCSLREAEWWDRVRDAAQA